MGKILLELYDGVVLTATIITQAEIDSTPTVPPYYNVISDYSGKSFDQLVAETGLRGRYKYALRKRDAMQSTGISMDIQIIDGNNPMDFWLKKYDKKKKTFSNIDGETDAQRQERISIRKSAYPVKQKDAKNVMGDDFGYMVPDQIEIDSVYGAGTFGS
jgi:hypothetical protein